VVLVRQMAPVVHELRPKRSVVGLHAILSARKSPSSQSRLACSSATWSQRRGTRAAEVPDHTRDVRKTQMDEQSRYRIAPATGRTSFVMSASKYARRSPEAAACSVIAICSDPSRSARRSPRPAPLELLKECDEAGGGYRDKSLDANPRPLVRDVGRAFNATRLLRGCHARSCVRASD
jgi:hypothetical protein